jgi:pre-mRNA cleavage complex 2 protein Pcf11
LQQQQKNVQDQTNSNAMGSVPPTAISANHRTVAAANRSNDDNVTSSSSSIYTTNFFKVNQIHIEDFTTEGIKQKKSITISLLYEIGLPYQSTIDGKRFRTEQQLSKHLDYIFQQKQKILSSSASSSLNTSSTERGWYIHDQVWTKEIEEMQHDPISSMTSNPTLNDTKQSADIQATTDPDQLYTVVADEARDTCVICGRRFIMYFDSQEGEYKYRNCISIPMRSQHDNDNDDLDHDVGLDDDDDEDEQNINGTHKTLQPQLIHGTCWIGLGQPETISYDQTIFINKNNDEDVVQ